MTITEFAILVFKPPYNLSDPTLHPLFRQLSAWQSECSGYPLVFFTDANDRHSSDSEVHLITGWDSVGAHEAWIRGERNQELLRVFGSYIDIRKIRMVHLDMDFESVPREAGRVVVERLRLRYASDLEGGSNGSTWSLIGRDLADENGDDVYRLVEGVREVGEGEGNCDVLVARWVLDSWVDI